MEASALTNVVLPAALFLIMLGMGLSLTPQDFKRVATAPRATLIGLVCQLLILPLVALAILALSSLSGSLAVGLMLIAACPGGVTSNLISHVSRGDTALSITLTAITSCVTVVTIPLIMSFALERYADGPTLISMPILETIGQVFAITILPVALGMIVRRYRVALAERLERPSRVASSVIFVVIVLGIILKERDTIAQHFMSLLGVTAGLNVVTMTIGYLAAALGRLPDAQRRTISIEAGVQNGTLAVVIATSILRDGEMALPGGIYSLVMFLSGALMMIWGARQHRRAERRAEAGTISGS